MILLGTVGRFFIFLIDDNEKFLVPELTASKVVCFRIALSRAIAANESRDAQHSGVVLDFGRFRFLLLRLNKVFYKRYLDQIT